YSYQKLKSVKMAKQILFTILILTTYVAQSQGIKYGGSIDLGVGGVESVSKVQQYYDQLVQKDQDLNEKTIKSKPGTAFGISGMAEYYLKKNISLFGGLQILRQKNSIELYEKEQKNNGDYKEIKSTATVSISSVIFPITFKYPFDIGKGKHPYMFGGTSLEFRVSKKMDSEETKIKFDAKDNDTQTNQFSFSDKDLEGFNTSSMNLVLGIGMDYVLSKDKVVYANLSFTTTAGKNEMWAKNLSSGSGNNDPKNSKIFDKSEHDAIVAAGYKLNDWKSTRYMLSVGMMIK
ncbi:hypothetical protein JYT36_00660, partial [Bacteroidales bacterium AH-315-N07]|nr:hypothetical protein [Bacteroidales bacterium AH-315-N07]